MGIYLNPDNELFRECLNSNIYVDKTELIHFTNNKVNTKNKLICVSRPRRFGKSMALEMLSAYYSKGCDSRELFADLKVCRYDKIKSEKINKSQAERFGKNLNAYDVLYIDMQGLLESTLEDLEVQEELSRFANEFNKMNAMERKQILHPRLTIVQRRLIEDLRKNEEIGKYVRDNEISLGNALLDIYNQSGNQFVMLIDEWDCIFRNYEDDRFFQDKYIDWLRSMFKDAARLPVFALVYMTGILPIKRYHTQSAMNNFMEYTFVNPHKLAEFSGFTEEEVKTLCAEYGISSEKMSDWYNGYYFKNSGKIYNPRSIVCAVENEEFGSYWTATGTYESIRRCIDQNFDGLKGKIISLLGNERCKVDTGGFNNTMTHFEGADDALTLLVHLGYLAYDSEKGEVYIPNKEVREEFVRAIDGKKWTETHEAIVNSEKLLEATLAGDEAKVAICIEKVHSENTAILTYNNENSLSCVLQIAYFKARDEYMMIREMPGGKGFADIVFIPRRGCGKPAIVMELKWEKNVETALDQMKNKQYGKQLENYFGEILLVGITYDKESKEKKHNCIIEKIVK